jgi:hypothetical protein
LGCAFHHVAGPDDPQGPAHDLLIRCSLQVMPPTGAHAVVTAAASGAEAAFMMNQELREQECQL